MSSVLSKLIYNNASILNVIGIRGHYLSMMRFDRTTASDLTVCVYVMCYEFYVNILILVVSDECSIYIAG